MATLAIQGHPERGNEVIEILEMLGGKNRSLLFGDSALYYAIDREGIISTHCGEQVIKFSLEEFLEKFPYKAGDKVQYKGATSCGSIFEVEEMRWEEDTVKYTLCLFGCNYKRYTLPAEYLQPYKEETMENKLEQIEIDIPNGYKFFGINDNNKVVLAKKQSQYPKTYEECCKVLNTYCTMPSRPGYKEALIAKFQELLICRDAYWKIVGDWKPDFLNPTKEMRYFLFYTGITIENGQSLFPTNKILIFPTAEIRDDFYENFIDLINECKDFI